MQITEADFYAAEREADYATINCEDGQGHDLVVEPAEPDLGFPGARYCQKCGADLRLP